MVIEVSAIDVASTILRLPAGAAVLTKPVSPARVRAWLEPGWGRFAVWALALGVLLRAAGGVLATGVYWTSPLTITFLPTQERIRADLRGKEATLTIGFRDVREKHVPNLDDDFARETGEAETFEALRAKFSDQVREEDQNEAERDARKRLVESLLERNPFEVAPSLVAREVAAQVDLFKRQLEQQGIKLNQTGMSEQQVAQQMRPQALFNVKAFLLLDAIGKAESLVVDEAEVDKELQNLAEERGQNIDRLRATMEKNNQLLLLRAQIREEKILDFLMSKAEVTEAPDPAPEAPDAAAAPAQAT